VNLIYVLSSFESPYVFIIRKFYFYCVLIFGRITTQLLLLIFGIVTWFFGIGILLLAILGVWWLVDAFLTYGMVREENEKRGLGASAVIFSKSNDNDSSDLDQLEKLYNLREKGALTEEEYRDRKSKIN